MCVPPVSTPHPDPHPTPSLLAPLTCTSVSRLSLYSHVILMGDLNFRCANLAPHDALEHISNGRLAPLLAADELRDAMRRDEVLHGFVEAAPITFLPSFRRVFGEAGRLTEAELASTADGKLNLGAGLSVARLQELYSTAAKDGTARTPSYTDRVLLHSLPDVREQMSCLAYSSGEGLALSDHRPVGADLQIAVDYHSQKTSAHVPHHCRVSLGQLRLAIEETAIEGERSGSVARRVSVADGSAPLSEESYALNEQSRAPISQRVRDVALLMPLPAERSGFALEAIESMLGGRGATDASGGASSCHEKLPWKNAEAPSCLSGSVSRDAIDPIHALVQLTDGGGKVLAEGVLAVHDPWVTRGSAGVTAASVTREMAPFELPLTRQGQLMGTLTGEAVVVWSSVAFARSRGFCRK